jgi:4,5-dihydroxyphthalate decarboxylase
MSEPVRCAFGCRYDFLPYLDNHIDSDIHFTAVRYNSPAEALDAVRSGAVDASEMSLSLYAALIANTEVRDLVGVPSFLLQTFRHGNLYVRSDSALVEPRELERRRIATLDYGITMAVWLRGCLTDQYGVDWSGVRWSTVREPAPEEVRPSELTVTRLPEGQSMWNALQEGSVDAVIGAAPHGEKVRRLIHGWRDAELEYYQRWGAYPIMHTMVVRRAALERNARLPSYLCQRIDRAREAIFRQYEESSGAILSLPLSSQLVGDASPLDSRQLTQSGLMANRKSLQVFLRYMYKQGLLQRPVEVESLFSLSI